MLRLHASVDIVFLRHQIDISEGSVLMHCDVTMTLSTIGKQYQLMREAVALRCTLGACKRMDVHTRLLLKLYFQNIPLRA